MGSVVRGAGHILQAKKEFLSARVSCSSPLPLSAATGTPTWILFWPVVFKPAAARSAHCPLLRSCRRPKPLYQSSPSPGQFFHPTLSSLPRGSHLSASASKCPSTYLAAPTRSLNARSIHARARLATPLESPPWVHGVPRRWGSRIVSAFPRSPSFSR